ncbi:MAG: ATP-binding protein, partial [Chloroflexota bacterium]|nr:ATP-binding protein [Chloroflexota bacterium]
VSAVVTMQDMAEVEELERLRADFLAMVSHELRGPLTSIKGSATTVLGSANELDPAVVRQFLRIIEEQADHMNRLVADLLDVARIETGELPVSLEPAEAAALVDRAKSAFNSAGGKSPLEIDIEPDLPLVLADRRRIVQVISNLLSNAARHSPQSSVIRVRVARRGVDLVFSVSDEGRGIPAESLPHLFRKFSRVQSEEQAGDTGLGLSICKGIVEAHGGRIWAESDGPGLGARFTFTLPTVEEAASGPASATPSPRRSQQGEPGERVRVLAVDDDPQTLRYVRDTLAGAGYDPIVTGDPEEALRLVDEARPQLALLDLMLPGIEGIQLMQDILAAADLPVIFLSAYGREDLIARAFDMGAADYMVKPFSPTELAARIRSALRRRTAADPSKPYLLGDLTIDYAERRVTLAGWPIPLTPIEYRMLAELSANAGQLMTYQRLLDRVWGEWGTGDLRPMRTIVSKLRRKLGEDMDNPTYIFTEPRLGYRMPKGT